LARTEPEILKEENDVSSPIPEYCYITIKDVPAAVWAKLRQWNQDNDHSLIVSAVGSNSDEIVILSEKQVDAWHNLKENPTGDKKPASPC
jgi:hypothetical protein